MRRGARKEVSSLQLAVSGKRWVINCGSASLRETLLSASRIKRIQGFHGLFVRSLISLRRCARKEVGSLQFAVSGKRWVINCGSASLRETLLSESRIKRIQGFHGIFSPALICSVSARNRSGLEALSKMADS